MDQFKRRSISVLSFGPVNRARSARGNAAGTHVYLVGAAQLCSLYGQAIEACGGSLRSKIGCRGSCLAAIARGYRGLSRGYEDARCPIYEGYSQRCGADLH